MSDVLDRFLKYCAVPSQSNPLTATNVPSTPAQFDMAQVLEQELLELGADNVVVNDTCYVCASWPASQGCEDLPCLGLCAHLDTAWQANGSPVHPRVVHYEGGNLVMGEVDGVSVFTTPEDNPALDHMVGWDIVCTDGTSLLGGDDKAGVAAIMSLLKRLKDDPTIAHPRLAIAFVPDEEIGHGASLLDLDAWGATWGYTVDGGPIGEFCYECFNAAEITLHAKGFSVHTGTAKGLMINAAESLMKVNALLPAQDRPEFTQDYEGFYYLERMEGGCEEATTAYIIRDHDAAQFAHRKQLIVDAIAYVNAQYGSEVITYEMHDQYLNMAEVVKDHKHLVDNARRAYVAQGIDMKIIPMRGGTDGAQLSYRGLPCPNLSACYYNAHGVKEFVPVPELEAMVDVLESLVGLYSTEQGL